jgi:hypothetical protein
MSEHKRNADRAGRTGVPPCGASLGEPRVVMKACCTGILAGVATECRAGGNGHQPVGLPASGRNATGGSVGIFPQSGWRGDLHRVDFRGCKRQLVLRKMLEWTNITFQVTSAPRVQLDDAARHLLSVGGNSRDGLGRKIQMPRRWRYSWYGGIAGSEQGTLTGVAFSARFQSAQTHNPIRLFASAHFPLRWTRDTPLSSVHIYQVHWLRYGSTSRQGLSGVTALCPMCPAELLCLSATVWLLIWHEQVLGKCFLPGDSSSRSASPLFAPAGIAISASIS